MGWVGLVVVVAFGLVTSSVVVLLGLRFAFRVGFLRGGGEVGFPLLMVGDMFSAWTTALAGSDASARVWVGAALSNGSGGTSENPSNALGIYHAFFHLVLS